MKKLYIIPSENAARYMVGKLYEEGYHWMGGTPSTGKHTYCPEVKCLILRTNMGAISFLNHTDFTYDDYDEVYEVEETVDFYVKGREKRAFKAGNIFVGQFISFSTEQQAYLLVQSSRGLQAINISSGGVWNHPTINEENIYRFTEKELTDWGVLPLLSTDYKMYESFDDYIYSLAIQS